MKCGLTALVRSRPAEPVAQTQKP